MHFQDIGCNLVFLCGLQLPEMNMYFTDNSVLFRIEIWFDFYALFFGK